MRPSEKYWIRSPHPEVFVSTVLKGLFVYVDRLANLSVPVLISGETGTGKEHIARALHYNGLRNQFPFVSVNCAELHHDLFQNEMFGHHKGSFTGAYETTSGKFQQAHGGTLFLDEITELRVEDQAKFLRVLQEQQVTPIGSTHIQHVDVRIVAATNKNLEEEVQMGRFKQDLFYRLNVATVHLSPLRERKEDILPLARYFLEKYNEEYGFNVQDFTPEASLRLLQDPWIGNVRELEHVIERSFIAGRPQNLFSLGDLYFNSQDLQNSFLDLHIPSQWFDDGVLLLPRTRLKDFEGSISDTTSLEGRKIYYDLAGKHVLLYVTPTSAGYLFKDATSPALPLLKERARVSALTDLLDKPFKVYTTQELERIGVSSHVIFRDLIQLAVESSRRVQFIPVSAEIMRDLNPPDIDKVLSSLHESYERFRNWKPS